MGCLTIQKRGSDGGCLYKKGVLMGADYTRVSDGHNEDRGGSDGSMQNIEGVLMGVCMNIKGVLICMHEY